MKHHDQLAKEAGCMTCHIKIPKKNATNSLILKKGASNWCLTCHSIQEGTSHPIGVKISNKCNLPLESGKRMSCLTCHNPHVSEIASEAWISDSLSKSKDGEFKTYLLNTPNTEGQLCKKCHADGELSDTFRAHTKTIFNNRGYAGSESCKKCHAKEYKMWKISPHANMVRTVDKVLTKEKIPLDQLNWPVEKIKYILGSHYVRRFVAKASGTLVVLPKIWDASRHIWLPVFDYGWKKRYWLKQCAGCHTTGFTVENDSFVEKGVGCESCHGPGLNHVRTGSIKYIVSPSRLTKKRREMICMSCHTSGVDNTATHQFPTGYKPGEDLTKFYSGLTPKPGQTSKNFMGDESFADRERQWQYLKNNQFLAQGLTCDYCQNFRNFVTKSHSRYMTKNEYCLTCHSNDMPKNHPKLKPNMSCVRCHIQAKNASGTLSIHDHKFTFH